MLCTDVRTLLASGQEPRGDPARLGEHLAACADCRRWRAAGMRLDDALSAARARVGPDVVAPVLHAWRAGAARRPAVPPRVIAALLALTGLLQLASGLEIALTHDNHGMNDAGALSAALGVGFLVAAIQPRVRLAGLLPVAFSATLFMLVGAAFDVSGGATNLDEELHHHLPALTGVMLLVAVKVLEARHLVAIGPEQGAG